MCRTQNVHDVNEHWIDNKSMQCCPNKLVYIKTNSFLYLVRNCSIILFSLKQDLGFLLSLEDNKDHRQNKPILNRSLSYAMLSKDTDLY